MTELSLFAEEAEDYRLPSLSETLSGPGNGLTAVSTFSGCGGSCLGLKRAGFRIPYAVEFVPAAAETYRANFPETFVDDRDVREITAGEILDFVELRPGELDLLEGSPPCASFSAAGSREKGRGTVKKYSDTKQRTDDLFWEYARLVEGLKPRAFIAENVPGMISGQTTVEEYAWKITNLLSRLGYHVYANVLNAAHYGVPQVRERLIFAGLRRDVPGAAGRFIFPPSKTTTVPHTVGQALALVDRDAPGEAEDRAASSMAGKAVGRTWEKLRAGTAPEELGKMCERCGGGLDTHQIPISDGEFVSLAEAEEYVRRGGEAKGLTTSGKIKTARCLDGEKAVIVKDYFMLVVPSFDQPSPTLTATGAGNGAASVTHPTECRKFTPREAMAVCGFPQDFTLTGTREQRYERMGRAVPPPFMAAVAGAVRDALT